MSKIYLKLNKYVEKINNEKYYDRKKEIQEYLDFLNENFNYFKSLIQKNRHSLKKEFYFFCDYFESFSQNEKVQEKNIKRLNEILLRCVFLKYENYYLKYNSSLYDLAIQSKNVSTFNFLDKREIFSYTDEIIKLYFKVIDKNQKNFILKEIIKAKLYEILKLWEIEKNISSSLIFEARIKKYILKVSAKFLIDENNNIEVQTKENLFNFSFEQIFNKIK